MHSSGFGLVKTGFLDPSSERHPILETILDAI